MSALPYLDRSVVDGAAFVVGLVALIAAAAVAFGGALTTPVVEALAPVFGPGWIAVSGLLAGGLAVYTAYERSAVEAPSPSVSVPTPPSRRDREAVETVGGKLDDLIDELDADPGDDVSRLDASVNRKRVRDRVREVAVGVVRDAEDCDPEAAGRMVTEGTWTNRPRARVFLGRDAPRLPLSVRLRDWASGEGFRRRAAAAVEAVAETADVDYGESIAPTPVGGEPEDTPVDWPPEPEPGDSEQLDRLLERPVEAVGPDGSDAARDPQPDPEPEPEPDPEPEPAVDGPEVFRREVIPGDAPSAQVESATEGGDAE